jgi:GH25 family lysozyme M1 (1,4-beta-N-acetylmuramidase)
MTVNKPCCIDLYHSDDVSDKPTALAGFDRVKGTGIFLLIHKASQGVSNRDSRYDARRAKWMTGNAIKVTDVDGASLSLSPIFGAYHFLEGAYPVKEAANFLMTARLTPTDQAFVDWEAVGASGHYPSLDAADTFCQAVEQATGRPCGVYGGNVPRETFASGRASSDVVERFSKRPLWFCAYGSYSPEKFASLIPLPWKETGVLLWQDDGDKSGPGPHTIPGINNYCDNSTVVGEMTFANLHNLWLGATA